MSLTKNLYNMKLKAIIYLIALMLPAAVSCKKEAEGNSASNAKVDFTAEAGVFKGGEMVTMLSEGLQADMDAVQFKVSDDGAFAQENAGSSASMGQKERHSEHGSHLTQSALRARSSSARPPIRVQKQDLWRATS